MTFSRTSRHGRRLEACFAWTANQAGPLGKGHCRGNPRQRAQCQPLARGQGEQAMCSPCRQSAQRNGETSLTWPWLLKNKTSEANLSLPHAVDQRSPPPAVRTDNPHQRKTQTD